MIFLQLACYRLSKAREHKSRDEEWDTDMADQYPLYIALRDLMVRAAPTMKIAKDVVGECTVNVPTATMASKDPVWFGTIRLTGQKVSYYLPALVMKECRDVAVPDALKAFAQSKTCFVFADIDADRFAELEAVTRTAAQALLPKAFAA